MKLALAPMQDVTDIAFVRTLHRINSLPDYLVTPYFRSTPTTCAFTEANLLMIEQNETDIPIWAQIAGSDPDAIMRDCEMLMRYPIAGIDLNAGCPSPLVNRNLAGASLLRDYPRFSAIAKAMRKGLDAGKFSIKCRLGWADEGEFPALLELIAEAAPDLLTVHGRTRQQAYRGKANLAPVAQAVKQLAPCPVMGNGDIITPEDAARWMHEVAPAGLMIGRGAVRNPYIFRQLKGGAPPTDHEMRHYYLCLIEETAKTITIKLPDRAEQTHCNRMKKYLAYIYPNLPEKLEYHLRRCKSMQEMKQYLITQNI